MADHEIDDYWWSSLEKRGRQVTKAKLTNCTIRFKEPCFHPFHHLVKGEQLKGSINGGLTSPDYRAHLEFLHFSVQRP